MRTIRRWTAGVFSRIDELVARVENHEALVTEALRDLQRSTARAHVQLKRVREDGERLRRQLAECREQSDAWQTRAKRADDDTRAIECLRRAKRFAAQAAEIERRLGEHERIERQLGEDVRGLEDRLARLKEQRNLMRTRQSRAEAMGVVQDSMISLGSDIDEVFDRWEARVTEAEYAGGVDAGAVDAFENEYLSAEEEAALRIELDELRRESDV
ncbi:MAG: PspA/IM30 family protein [Gammaproteobacteria bacterium]|nr:PspA/IM30 family protein [Gammaproteobacteria bacterium]